MPETVTNHYRKFLAQQYLNSLANSAVRLFMFIGRVLPWADSANSAVSDTNPPVVLDTPQDENYTAWRDMLGVVTIASANTAYVIPRITWTLDTVYTQYDDTVSLTNASFYVLDTSSLPYAVYKCLWNANNTVSTVAPSTTGTLTTPQIAADGYVWQYMYTIPTSNSDPFLTSTWMPVYSNTVVSNAATLAVGTLPTAVPLIITSGGSGYNAAANVTVTLQGDGSGAAVSNTVGITGTAITSLILSSGGNNYTQVTSINVYQNGVSSQANVRAIIPPYPNHGYDPLRELAHPSVMLLAVFNTSQNGNLTGVNDFRRIGILRDPLLANGSIANGTFYRQTYDLTLSANTGTFSPDDLVFNATDPAHPTGVVVDVVQNGNGANVLRLTSVNPMGSETIFTANDVVTCNASGVTGTVASMTPPDLQLYSGEILYVEQRTPVTRTNTTSETIRVVFSFD